MKLVSNSIVLLALCTPFTAYSENIVDDTASAFGNAASDVGGAIGDTADDVGQVTSDSAITTSVKTQYAASSDLSVFDISVSTTDGVVYLIGTLKTQDQVDQAVKIAEDTNDVKSVDSSKLLFQKNSQ